MILVADKLKAKIKEPDYIVFTNNGVADLDKKGLTGYYVWVGYVHAGRNGRSDPKRMRAIENKLEDIAEALADIAKGDVNDVVIEDFTRSFDMYRLYIVK